MNTNPFRKSVYGKTASRKNVILATAIATAFLIAAVGSASALPACPAPGNTDISSSCELTQDYTVSTAGQYGYKIVADNVVIDGKGYKITGAMPDSCGGGEAAPCTCAGIINYNNDSAVVKNLEITDFCTGIVVGDNVGDDVADNMTVEGCKIHDCGEPTGTTHGIHLVRANDCTFSMNEIYNIDGTGSEAGCGGGGNGIFGYGADEPHGKNNVVTCNHLHYNTKSGMFTKKVCDHWTISYNNASYNGETGIRPMCKKSSYCTIEYNIMTGNTGGGYVSQANNNTLRYNTIRNNGNFGIQFISDQYGTPPYGMNNKAYNNTICGHTVLDIRQNPPSGDGGTNTAGDNTCTNSDLGGCDWSCDSLVPVYYDFDKDEDCSKEDADCSCGNVLGVGSCCNPGLFNSSGAGQHCIGVCNTSVGNDPNDCNASVFGDPKVPPLSELPGPTPTPTPPHGKEITVSATVGIAPPEVICKCETPDDDPIEEGTQVRSNLWPDTKTVMKCAIACDPNGIGDIKYVNATTYYPNGTVKETQTMHVANESEKAACCCDTTGLPNETCQVYAGYITMEACDPAGDYTVTVTATDDGGATGEMSNQFEYLSIIGLDLDLNAVGFGTVAPGETKVVPGDDSWGVPNLTVHSIGNDPIDIEVSATDMTSDGNVITKDNIDCEIDALGSQWLSAPFTFDINLECCSYENVDLSLHVPEGTAQGAYTGTVTFVAKHA